MRIESDTSRQRNRSPTEKLAGSIASLGRRNRGFSIRNQEARRGMLAPAAGAPRCTATCAPRPHPRPHANAASATSDTDATSARSAAATTSAAAATSASAEAATSASATASAATAPAACAREQYATRVDVFSIDEMEGGEADVGKFFFTERDHVARCKVRRLWCRHAIGTADANALPAIEKVNPAAPKAGTAALVTRFFSEACFTRGMVASSNIARRISVGIILR